MQRKARAQRRLSRDRRAHSADGAPGLPRRHACASSKRSRSSYCAAVVIRMSARSSPCSGVSADTCASARSPLATAAFGSPSAAYTPAIVRVSRATVAGSSLSSRSRCSLPLSINSRAVSEWPSVLSGAAASNSDTRKSRERPALCASRRACSSAASARCFSASRRQTNTAISAAMTATPATA